MYLLHEDTLLLRLSSCCSMATSQRTCSMTCPDHHTVLNMRDFPGAMASSRMAGWEAALHEVQRTTSDLWRGGSASAQVSACNGLKFLIRKHKGVTLQLRQKLVTEVQVRPVHGLSTGSVLAGRLRGRCRSLVLASSSDLRPQNMVV